MRPVLLSIIVATPELDDLQVSGTVEETGRLNESPTQERKPQSAASELGDEQPAPTHR